jgi:hypothetical protein
VERRAVMPSLPLPVLFTLLAASLLAGWLRTRRS